MPPEKKARAVEDSLRLLTDSADACRAAGMAVEIVNRASTPGRAAAALNRTLLVRDTRRGDAAEQLYAGLGDRQAGVIPRYAMSARGTLDDTVYMYRELGSAKTLTGA